MRGGCRAARSAGALWLGALVAALAPLLADPSLAGTPRMVPLVEAVRNGDGAAVRALLARRVDVNRPDVDGSTPLLYAVLTGQRNIVDALLRAGAAVNAANRYGVAPLALAAENGDATLIERLLAAGASAKSTSRGGESVLMLASRNESPEAVRVLLAHGADPNLAEPGKHQTALMWAAASNNVKVMQVLLAAGADVRARSDEFNDRPVQGGSAANDWLPRAVNETVYRFTPLLFAVLNGHIDATKVLLDAGADPNETTLPDGTSALVLACINAHWELASVLLDRGADPNAARQGWTALHQIARTRTPSVGRVPAPIPTGHMDSLQLVERLIARGADVNARATKELVDIYRRSVTWLDATPFFVAAKGGDHELMRLLAQRGADSTLGNKGQETPLMVASGVGQWEVGGEAINAENSYEAVKLCLELTHGCGDVNAKNSRGVTALHGAALTGATRVVQLLADRGAALDARNIAGQTPYVWAVGRDIHGESIFRLTHEQTAALIARLLTAKGLPVEVLPPPVYSRGRLDEAAARQTPGAPATKPAAGSPAGR